MKGLESSRQETDNSGYQESSDSKLRQFENLIAHAVPISPVDRSKAPFRNYAENTEKQWQYVSPDEIDSYLKEKFFFDVNDIPFEDKVGVGEIDISNTDQFVKVPLDLVVFAAGFKDWRGRGENTGKTYVSKFGISFESKSIDAIKHYANLSTDLPEVGRVNMYKQPDGKVYFSNSAGDSHRISAAILRGCEFVETSRVGIYEVKKNYI